jgi:hypothetical protein
MVDNNTTYNTTDLENDDVIEGVDGHPTGDAEKGATLGGIGGAVVGAMAGAMAGPIGAVAGAIIGGISGGVASGAAVGAIDRHDNDGNVVGVGNGVPGVQTGGHDVDGSPDTRGIWEKTADTVTGDRYDDKTGKPVASDTVRSDAYAVGNATTYGGSTVANDIRGDVNSVRSDVDNATYGTRAAANSGIGTGFSREGEVGEGMPSFKTGGVANDGTPDTRGVGEKLADGLTGDNVDDKTGRVVDHA